MDGFDFTGMWLELPIGVDASDSNTACLEPLYYRVVLSLLSLLTRCVEGGASEPDRGDGGKDDDNSGGLTNAAKVLLQTVLTVSTIQYSVILCMPVNLNGQGYYCPPHPPPPTPTHHPHTHAYIRTHTHTLIHTHL
jgi:hypothetical protein